MFVDYEVPFRGHCLITGSEIENEPGILTMTRSVEAVRSESHRPGSHRDAR